MMRYKLLHIGTLKGFWVSDNYRQHGFEEVFETELYDYRKHEKNVCKMGNELQKIVFDFKPDIIFINKGELIPSIIVERIKRVMPKTFVVNFNGDQRGKAQAEAILLGRVCDAILINNAYRSQWEEYLEFGVKNVYEYHTATDLTTYFPMPMENINYDIIFIGGYYEKRFPLSYFRGKCINELSKRYKVAVAGGARWKNNNRIIYLGNKYGEYFTKAVAQSKIVLGIDAFDKINNYTSNRTWNSMACGKPYLCHYYEGIENFFEDNKNIMIFKNLSQLIDKVRWALDHPRLAAAIGKSGMEIIKKKHTYTHRAIQLKTIYEEWKHDNSSTTNVKS